MKRYIPPASKPGDTVTDTIDSGTELEFHPFAEIFPLLEGEEFRNLVEDIREHGLREHIWLYEGKVLDGRNRHRACIEAGVEPHFKEFQGDHAAAKAFVISKNIMRRHLSAEQKRKLIADLLKKDSCRSDRQIGRLVGVSHNTVAAVRREAEGRGQIDHTGHRADSTGRKQPARKMKEEAHKKGTVPISPAPDITAPADPDPVVTGDIVEGIRYAGNLARKLKLGEGCTELTAPLIKAEVDATAAAWIALRDSLKLTPQSAPEPVIH
jgi:transposase-like protein